MPRGNGDRENRTPLAAANPLTEQLNATLAAAQMGEDTRLLRVPEVYSGTAGVGGRAVTPAALVAAIENMTRNGRRSFVLGIKHPDALVVGPEIDTRPRGSYSLRIHSRAGFGSNATARLIGMIAADLFGVEIQVESSYRGEERVVPMSASVTLAPKRLQAHADPPVVDIVAVHDSGAFQYSDPLAGLRAEGTLILETSAPSKEVWGSLPVDVRRSLRERNIDLFALDAAEIATGSSGSPDRAARAHGLALAGAFLKVSPWRNQVGLPEEALAGGIERALTRLFEHRGEIAVAEAKKIVERGYAEVRLVIPPEQTTDYQASAGRKSQRNGFKPDAASDLVPAGFCDHVIQNYVDGRDSVLDADLYVARSIMPAGSAHFRSFRQLAPRIPRFNAKDCTGCMECVNLCPDGAIFARVVDPETIEHARRKSTPSSASRRNTTRRISRRARRAACSGCTSMRTAARAAANASKCARIIKRWK